MKIKVLLIAAACSMGALGAYAQKGVDNGTQFGSGEDSIFIYDCIKSGMKVYTSPEIILTIPKSDSTWFEGYNEKYFYDKGALMARIFGRKANIIIPVFLLKNRKTIKKIKSKTAYELMRKGCREFEK